MRRITISTLRTKVDKLNKEYKLSDKTPCKLDVMYAYGGYQVVLKVNPPYGNFVRPVTIGFYPAKDVYANLIYEEFYCGLSYSIVKFTEQLIDSYNRR